MEVGDPRWVTKNMAGHPTYHVNVIKLKWKIIWTNGLPLPHLQQALSHLFQWQSLQTVPIAGL